MAPAREAHREQTLLLEVTARAEEADGVVSLRLRTADGTPLPPWEPGAHVDLELQPDLVRQYSLCGDPGRDDEWRVGVLREADGRGGSRHVHERIAVGDRLPARGPRNNFALRPASRYLFVAGGIGITPILPMVRRAVSRKIPWTLLYGGRRRTSMAFVDELPSGGRVELCPEDEFGLLDLDRWLGAPTEGTEVYCCGPEPLLAAVEERCASWPTGALHLERFVPSQKAAARASDGTFVVELARSGRRLEVGPHDCLLDVLEADGHDITNSCRAGICGTCLTGVVDGVPDHLDDVLSDDERESNQVILPCVSRAKTGRLVLDL